MAIVRHGRCWRCSGLIGVPATATVRVGVTVEGDNGAITAHLDCWHTMLGLVAGDYHELQYRAHEMARRERQDTA